MSISSFHEGTKFSRRTRTGLYVQASEFSPHAIMDLMDSKKSLGLVGLLSVVALVAAIWMVARPSQVALPDPSASADVAPISSRPEKVALQFYRNPAAVADVMMKDVDGRPIST